MEITRRKLFKIAFVAAITMLAGFRPIKRYFKGRIGNLRIYTRLLSEAEIMRAWKPPLAEGLVAWWEPGVD